jgi:hypothetical protein
MKAPSPPARAELPTVESPSRIAVRRLPLAPVGGWRWLWNKQEKALRSPAPQRQRPSLTVSRHRSMKRCGRAVVLWGLLWYIVVQAIPTYFKDRWQRMGPAYESQKWPTLEQHVAQNPDRPLLLMLGSSRVCWDFRAGVLNGMPDSDGRPLLVYNFGIPGTGPIYQVICLREMLAKGIRPRFLLVEFLPTLLCEPHRGVLTEEGMLEYETISARRFLQWMPYLQRLKKDAGIWLEARVAPVYTFRYQILAEMGLLATGMPLPKYDLIDEYGWHMAPPLPFLPVERAKRLVAARGGYSPGLTKFHLGKVPYRAFHELLDLCRQEKIPVALVVTPEDSHFRSWYSDEAKTTARRLLDEFQQTYGVAVIDAQCWLDDEHFEDGHHALYEGAKICTARLAAELPRLLAQSKTAKSD